MLQYTEIEAPKLYKSYFPGLSPNVSPNGTQSAQRCDKVNSTFTIGENANVTDKCRNSKKPLNISEIHNVNMLVEKKTLPMQTEKTDNITYNNMQQNNMFYVITDSNISSNVDKTCIIGTSSNNTFTPLAESTFVEKQLTAECEVNNNNNNNNINNNNTDSDNCIISKNNIDDSFHLSDCSIDEDTDEYETEGTPEHATTSKNKTVNNTLNLTSSRSSKAAICDDRDMYVETSDNLKLKLNMCLYCKKLQTQLARHLETVHKTEEEVKKFCFLPKGKLYVIQSR